MTLLIDEPNMWQFIVAFNLLFSSAFFNSASLKLKQLMIAKTDLSEVGKI